MIAPTLQNLDENLWVATRPLRLRVGDVGCRMTVIRLSGDQLFLHSPVKLDTETKDALNAIGTVKWIVGPSKVHHLFLGDYVEAYPDATLVGAPGLDKKRKDLAFSVVLDGDDSALWGSQIASSRFPIAPGIQEIVFYHPRTRTLILTDLAFNVCGAIRNEAKVFHWLVGATDRFGPHRLVRFGMRDRAGARCAFDEIMEWDYDRIVMSHGEVLETGGRKAMIKAFEFLNSDRD